MEKALNVIIIMFVMVVLSNCRSFADDFDKLEQCESFVADFKHPFTGENLKREIMGIEGEKCVYIEEMPNGGKMTCKFSPSQRKAAAQYYRDVASATLSGTEIKPDLSTGELKTRYTIDGKEVENPLQASFDDGTCVITGYNSPDSFTPKQESFVSD